MHLCSIKHCFIQFCYTLLWYICALFLKADEWSAYNMQIAQGGGKLSGRTGHSDGSFYVSQFFVWSEKGKPSEGTPKPLSYVSNYTK